MGCLRLCRALARHSLDPGAWWSQLALPGQLPVYGEQEKIQDQPCRRGFSSEEQKKEFVAQEKVLKRLVGVFPGEM